MTDEQINIAIAEACGWERGRVMLRYGGRETVWRKGHRELRKHELPNYVDDLNAMHEAEKVLTEKQQVWYLQKLTQVRYKDGVSGMIACMIDKTTFATARQRAEAFLRTLGKWSDQSST